MTTSARARTRVSSRDHICPCSSLADERQPRIRRPLAASLLHSRGVCCSSSMLAEPTRPPHSARSHAQTRVTCWLVDRRTVLGVTAVSLNESRAGWSRFSGSPAPAGSWVVPFPCAHRISVRVQRHRHQWPVPAFSGVAPFCVLGCRSRSFVVLVFFVTHVARSARRVLVLYSHLSPMAHSVFFAPDASP